MLGMLVQVGGRGMCERIRQPTLVQRAARGCSGRKLIKRMGKAVPAPLELHCSCAGAGLQAAAAAAAAAEKVARHDILSYNKHNRKVVPILGPQKEGLRRLISACWR